MSTLFKAHTLWICVIVFINRLAFARTFARVKVIWNNLHGPIYVCTKMYQKMSAIKAWKRNKKFLHLKYLYIIYIIHL